jgi:LysR family nitrogen assimilation transcriptional regulator
MLAVHTSYGPGATYAPRLRREGARRALRERAACDGSPDTLPRGMAVGPRRIPGGSLADIEGEKVTTGAMNSDDLMLFLSVAINGNFSRASIDIGLSQSALSRRIAALEAALNTRLFYRSGRGVILTESGERLFKYAGEVKELLESAAAALSAPSHQGPASIVLAAQPTLARILFGSIGKALKLQYPGIKMRFKEGLGGHIQEWIANGEVDAAIVYLPESHASLGVDVILRERLSFIAPPAFGPLGAGFAVERLGSVPLVLPTHPHGLRVLAESLAARHSTPLDISMECDASVYITKQLVAENCGCTILPLAAVREEMRAGVLQAAPLTDPEVVRDVAIVSGRNRPPVPSQWQVLRTVRQQMTSMVESGAWPDTVLV